MAFEELTSQLTLDSSGYTSGAEDAEQASEDLAESTGAVQDGLFDLDAAGVAAGAGIAAVGGAITGVVESSKEWRESLGRTRTTMGLTQEEANGLARSISNATFPMDDAVGTMDALARQGVETEDAMENVATAADMIADATGTSATSIAENAVPALRAMGGEAEDLEANMDAFTFVARNTTMSVEDFSRVVTKTGPEIQEMGLSVDDTATIMAALEERGLDSRTAMREFRQAARDAEGDQQKLKETLGLTAEELDTQQQALANSQGATEAHAEAANESVTTMDELRHAFDEATLAMGGFLQPVEAAGPVLMGLGGALSAVSAINFGAVIPSLVGVMTAISPLLPLILGLTAVAGGLYAAWDSNFLGIQNVTEDVLGALGDGFDWLTDKVSGSVDWVIEQIFLLPDALGAVIDAIPGIDSEDVLGNVDMEEVKANLFPPKPGEEGSKDAEQYVNSYKQTLRDETGGGGGTAGASGGGGTSGGGGGGAVQGVTADEINAFAAEHGTARPEDFGMSSEEFNRVLDSGGSAAPSGRSSATSSQLRAEDIAKAVRQALEDLRLEGELSVSPRSFDELLEDKMVEIVGPRR